MCAPFGRSPIWMKGSWPELRNQKGADGGTSLSFLFRVPVVAVARKKFTQRQISGRT